MELGLKTFNSIIHGNLMPWLTENQDTDKFRLLLRKIAQAESQANYSFFNALQYVTHDMGLNSGQKLKEEWESFAQVTVHPDASGLIPPFIQIQDENPKLAFYTSLIAHCIKYLFSLITVCKAENQSQTILKHRIMNYMKSLSDMIIIARVIHPSAEIDCAIIDRLLAGLAMLYAETGNRFPEFIEPAMLRVSNADIRNILLATDYCDKNTCLLFTTLAGKYYPVSIAKLAAPSSLPTGEEDTGSVLAHFSTGIVPTNDSDLLREMVKTQEDLAGLKKDVTGMMNKKEAHPKPEVQLIGSAEVCRILHISKSTLMAHRKKGLYSATKIGSRYLYSAIEINKILELKKHL